MGQPRSIRDGLRRVWTDGGGLRGASIRSDPDRNSRSDSDPDLNTVLNARTNSDSHSDPYPNGGSKRVTDSGAQPELVKRGGRGTGGGLADETDRSNKLVVRGE